MKIERQILAAAILLVYSNSAHSESLLWTTGTPSLVFQDCGCFGKSPPSRFGYISGRLNSSSPQRWSAVPFRLDEPSHISQLEAYYTDPNNTVTNVEYIIWNRNGLAAPTTMAASGSLGPHSAGTGTDTATQDFHQHAVDVSLLAGDYYLTLYGSGAPGQTAYIGWWAGGTLQDPVLEQNFMWRSASFPTPGFQHYTYGGSTNLLADYKDVYNPAFTLYGEAVPEPASVLLVMFGLVFIVVCRFRWANASNQFGRELRKTDSTRVSQRILVEEPFRSLLRRRQRRGVLPSAASLSAAVPEPATVGLLVVGMLAMISLRRASVSQTHAEAECAVY